MDPNALIKSMYMRYMSCCVSLASSRADIMVCICLLVHCSCLKSSWLQCSIWCFSPYAASKVVNVLVNSLYMVFARAIGLWLDSIVGSPFCIGKLCY